MRRRLRSALTMLASAAVVGPLALAPVVRAQDDTPAPTPSPFCAILTEAEVSAAVKVDVVIDDGSDVDCDYGSVKDYTYIDVRVETGAIDDTLRSGFPDFQDVTIAGQPGLLAPDGSVLYIQTDFGLLTVQLIGGVGEGAKARASSRSRTGLPRSTSMPVALSSGRSMPRTRSSRRYSPSCPDRAFGNLP